MRRPAPFVLSPPPPLTSAESEAIAARVAIARRHPNVIEIVRELHAEGLIHGWRNLTRIEERC